MISKAKIILGDSRSMEGDSIKGMDTKYGYQQMGAE